MHRRRLSVPAPFRRVLIGMTLGAALCVPAAPARADGLPAETRYYQIPAGSLEAAVNRLGREAGVMISFGSHIAAGRQTAGLDGRYSLLDALKQLLVGSGIEVAGDARDGFVLRPDGRSSAGGNPDSLPAVVVIADRLRDEIRLPVVVISDRRPPLAPGRAVLSADDIRNTPAANGDLSELLATHPAVRQNSSAGGSLTRGSLAPEDLSFHGASPYQNLFQIDGMDGSNNINPANKNSNLQVRNIPSNSQAYFLDTRLLGEVRVFDSNIPVEYGRFNGGVVDARLKRASGQDSVDVGYRMSGSNLSEQRVSDGNQSNYDLGMSGYTPDWRKRFYSLNVDRKLDDRFGVVLGLSRRESDIRRASSVSLDKSVVAGTSTEQDRVDNLLGKLSWWIDSDTVTDLTLKYSARREQRANSLFVDSRWDNEHDAAGVAWNLDQRLNGAKFNFQLGWDRFDDSRTSNSDDLVTHYFASTRTQFTTGGLGKEQKTRDSWALKARLDLDPLLTGPVAHTLSVGVDSQWVEVDYQRFNDASSYRLTHQANGSEKITSLTRYHAGQVGVSYNSQALWLADEMRWGRVSLTPGLRFDRDSYLGNSNLSPRTRLDWDLFGSRQSVVTLGMARYYGDNVLDLALRERVSKLTESVLNSAGLPVASPGSGEISRYRDLDTPYNDERSLALTQQFAGLEGVLSYVHREGRDQINKRALRDSKNVLLGYEYVNDGESRTDSFGLSLANQRPWQALGADWQMRLALSYERFRSNNSLVDGYDDTGVDNEQIYYNGKLIDAADRPTANFNQPSRVTLDLNAGWNGIGLRWNNRFNWLSKRDDVFYVGVNKADQLDMYQEGTLPSYWTWDARLVWQPTFWRQLELTVDILNVLNRQPVLVSTSPLIKRNNDQYGNGREIWLQANYRF